MPILTPATPEEITKILDLHENVCRISVKLSEIDINDYPISEDQKARFISDRFWYLNYKQRLALHALTVIVSRLKALEPEIGAATNRLEQELQDIQDFLEVLILMEKVILLVQQVVLPGQPF